MMHAPRIPDHPRYEIIDHEVVLVNERKKLTGGAGAGAESTEGKSFQEIFSEQKELDTGNLSGYAKLDLNKKTGTFLFAMEENGVETKHPSVKENGRSDQSPAEAQENLAQTQNMELTGNISQIQEAEEKLWKKLSAMWKKFFLEEKNKKSKKKKKEQRDEYIPSEQTEDYKTDSYNRKGELK